MENVFPCSEIDFTCKDFQVGYVPDDVQVIQTGLLSITATEDFPLASLAIDVESHCSELRFPNGSGVYNQATYTVTVLRGQTVYIPFGLKLTECGKFECVVSYEFNIDQDEDVITCESEAKVHAYNATCDWQECLVGTSRDSVSSVFCNPEVDCNPDLCESPELQRLSVLVALDKTLNYKIAQGQWSQVDALFRRGLEICDCIEKPNPCPGCEEKRMRDEDCHENIVNE